MLHEVLRETFTRMPKIFELSPARARMGDMIEKLGQAVDEKKKKRPGYHVKDYVNSPTFLQRIGFQAKP